MPRIDVRYVPAISFATTFPSSGELLGVIGFGAPRPTRSPCPFAEAEVPVLDHTPTYEVWQSDRPVSCRDRNGMSTARDDAFLFGIIETDEAAGANLALVTRDLYRRIFGCLEEEGYPHLLRVAHYVPRITGLENGTQRYRRFSVGRHHAFLDHGRDVESAPAACALGTRGEKLLVYFLAGRYSGCPVENPRQTSAYRYPLLYGLRSPTFSRAMIIPGQVDRLLLISGTASIVGHESLHMGDVGAQTREIVTNLRAVLAAGEGLGGEVDATTLQLKVYARDPSATPTIRTVLSDMLPTKSRLFLHADICRPELLVEIEGVCSFLPPSAVPVR